MSHKEKVDFIIERLEDRVWSIVRVKYLSYHTQWHIYPEHHIRIRAWRPKYPFQLTQTAPCGFVIDTSRDLQAVGIKIGMAVEFFDNLCPYCKKMLNDQPERYDLKPKWIVCKMDDSYTLKEWEEKQALGYAVQTYEQLYGKES